MHLKKKVSMFLMTLIIQARLLYFDYKQQPKSLTRVVFYFRGCSKSPMKMTLRISALACFTEKRVAPATSRCREVISSVKASKKLAEVVLLTFLTAYIPLFKAALP